MMKLKKTKIFRLPAYTTILCQTFSPDGNYLAVGSDFGRIAIFKIANIVSEGRASKENEASSDICKNKNRKKNSSIFHFDVGSNEVLSSRQIYKVCYTNKTSFPLLSKYYSVICSK